MEEVEEEVGADRCGDGGSLAGFAAAVVRGVEEDGVEGAVWHYACGVKDGFEREDRGKVLFGGVLGPVVEDCDDEDGEADGWRGDGETDDGAAFAFGDFDEVVHEGEHGGDFVWGERQLACPDGVPLRVRLVGEFDSDAKGLAGAADSPEEVRVLGRASGDKRAVGQNHTDREEVIDHEAVGAREPAIATAEGETADAGMIDSSAYSCQAMFAGCFVDIDPEAATLGGDGESRGIDCHFAHKGQIDHDTAL